MLFAMDSAARAKKHPVTARGQRTQQQLLLSAERVFADMGYANASIAEITRRAGIGLGTFYVYYPNKEALFLELVDEMGVRLKTEVGAKMGQFTDRMQRQRAAFQGFMEFTAKNRHLYRVIRQVELVDEQTYRQYYRRLANTYAEALKQAMLEGEVARYDPEALAWMLMGIADFIGLRYVVWEEEPEFERILDDVAAFIEGGLRSPLRLVKR